MNSEKILQELSNCKNKDETQKLLRKNRNTRDLYSVQVKAAIEYKNIKIKSNK